MNILEVKELKKSYTTPSGTRELIIDVPNFTIDEGEQIALSGESGSGKTTFLNLVAGILKPDSGVITLAGKEITALSEAQMDSVRADTMGYIFQSFNLLQGYTATENVLLGMMFGPGSDKSKAAELLDRVGLTDRADYKPRQLSVGQQQRVSLARALANDPKLVLADEPTGNLDLNMKTQAVKLIRDVCRENGASLLLVSHDENVLQMFDNVLEFHTINRMN